MNFETLYISNYKLLLSRARKIVRRREVAEEVVQTAYIKIRVAAPATVNLAYIVATVESLAKKAITHVHKFVSDLVLAKTVDTKSGPDKFCEANEMSNLLLDAVSTLPKVRQRIVSATIAGLSATEIAARLDSTAENVRLNLSFAVADIKRLVAGEV